MKLEIIIYHLMYRHKEEVNALVRTGYYFRVKHLLDKYTKNGEYLINTDVYPNLIVLQYVSPSDCFSDIKQDKILL